MAFDKYGEDEDEGRSRSGRRATDFDCPSCSAHNPVGEPLSEGDELFCNYCGSEFEVRFGSEGQLRLRER